MTLIQRIFKIGQGQLMYVFGKRYEGDVSLVFILLNIIFTRREHLNMILFVYQPNFYIRFYTFVQKLNVS